MSPWMELVAALADAASWPIVLLILAVIFRKPVKGLIDGLEMIGIRDNMVTVKRHLDAAKDNANQLPDAPDKTDDQSAVAIHAKASVERSPRAAVIEAWLDVDKSLRDVCDRLDLDRSRWRPAGKIIRLLENAGHLDADGLGILRHLNHVRNEAAHSRRFTISSYMAEEYVRLCSSASRYLESIGWPQQRTAVE
ncbi:MAG: hypothetical protein OXG74_16910 [Acidobacteria bacterium]|nr:hypothetical protein [Acidobacteriota bacterium]